VADTLRIKRRVTGSPGAPTSLANAELAYNEVDHILYYGEGTGGGGGTASVIVGIGGQGMSSAANPTMNGTAAPGSGTTWSRNDHVHPSDTTRAPLASPVFTGTPSLPTGTIAVTQTAGNNTTAVATTAFVGTAVSAATAGVASFNTRTGAVTLLLADVTGAGGAPIAGPTFTGVASAVTPANGTNTTQLATTQYVMAQRLDQFVAPNVDVAWNTHKITGLLDPTNPQEVATKNYVDGVAQGLDAKASARIATTANITLSGSQTIDGVITLTNDRILVKNQTTPSQNGIYIAQSGAWTRALDMNTWVEVPSAYVFVEEGTVNTATGWVCTAQQGGTIDSSAMNWTQFSGAGTIVAGAGILKTGNSFDVIGTTNRIQVNADNIDIAATYVGQSSITTLGTVTTGVWNGTTIAVANGGSGVATVTGYLKGNGTSAFTGNATIPSTDITGLGTMSTQNATAVAITGGTIDGVTFDMGTF
jgi:hypothetical protein